ncbi:hypothetical protein Bbelb_439560 [Branchiostoma belcheri]|nr:hypothetical protein Bbelb_439560 [Branchiostoma belcheri]
MRDIWQTYCLTIRCIRTAPPSRPDFRKDHGCRTSDQLVNVVTMSGQVDPSHGTDIPNVCWGYGPERSLVEASGTGHVSGSSRGGAHESAADCYRSPKADIVADDSHMYSGEEPSSANATCKPRIHGSGVSCQKMYLSTGDRKDLPPLEIHHRIDHAVDIVDEFLIVAKRNVFTCSPHDCDYRQTFVTVKSGGTNAEIGDRSRLSLSSLRSPFPDPGACLG